MVGVHPIETPRMNLPKYRAGPVEFWMSEAATQFINGFIASFKIGASVGVISGGGGVAATQMGEKISPLLNGLFAVGGILATCAAGGIAQVHEWHKTNPFPNPYPKPPVQP
jgi:hypothetical protein